MLDGMKTAYAFGNLKPEEEKKKDSIKAAKILMIIGALAALTIDFYIGIGLIAGAAITYILKK